MAKFKKGDKVRVLDGSKIERYFGTWVTGMNDYVGREYCIDGIVERGDRTGYYLTDEKHAYYIFDERGLALIEENKQESISIYRDGNKVIARDIDTGKVGVAKCAPEDAFDFMTGAKLALERLREQFPKHKFKVGDRVIGNTEASSYYSITRFGWIGEVVELEDDLEFTVRGPGVTGPNSLFSSLREECFDLYDGFLPGDKVIVTENGAGAIDNVIKALTDLTSDTDYLVRFAYGSNAATVSVFKAAGTVLKIIAVNKDYALVAPTGAESQADLFAVKVKALAKCR